MKTPEEKEDFKAVRLCFSCKHAEKIELFIEATEAPISITYLCKSKNIRLYDFYPCEKFEPINN